MSQEPLESRAPWLQDLLPDDILFAKAQQAQPDLVIVSVLLAPEKALYRGEEVMEVNHGLHSCTQTVQHVTITLPKDHKRWPNRRLLLVESPGFDNSEHGEFEVLRQIAVWLASAYGDDAHIAGLVYLHDIGKTRVGGTGVLSYDLFRQICGTNALNRVVMATTQWDTVAANPKAGQVREKELQESFWAEALEEGAHYMRVENPQDDVREVIEYILTKQFEAVVTKIQVELVQLDKRVAETGAGQTLVNALHKQLMGTDYKLDPRDDQGK
ncbi:hypothetical protein MD484_g5747, partial [Candolleomyces efflorescens]